MVANKILLVGGSGYLGQHLQKVLVNEGYDVFITGTKESNSINYLKLDFDNVGSFQVLAGKSFDIVMVLASKLNALGSTDLAHPDLKTNTSGYASFLTFLSKEKVASKIIYTSSMTVYGTDNRLPVKEDGKLAPVHTYGLSKLMAEQLTSFFCIHNNVKGAILRLPGIYGGNRKAGFIYNVADKCSRNEKVVLKSEGLIFWETINIYDLCSMMIRFIKAYTWQSDVDIFNVGYGEETDFYTSAHTIKRLLSSESEIEKTGAKGYIPFFLSNEKMKTVIPIQENFRVSLKKYVESIKQ